MRRDLQHSACQTRAPAGQLRDDRQDRRVHGEALQRAVEREAVQVALAVDAESRRQLLPGNVELLDVPEPTAGPDQVVIKVHNAGIRSTDIHILKSEYVIHPPVVMGHEVCGEVVETGTGVTGFAVGDRVTVNPTAGRLCGTCRYCRSGAPFFCIDRAGLGTGINGGFARYCAARQGDPLPRAGWPGPHRCRAQ